MVLVNIDTATMKMQCYNDYTIVQNMLSCLLYELFEIYYKGKQIDYFRALVIVSYLASLNVLIVWYMYT